MPINWPVNVAETSVTRVGRFCCFRTDASNCWNNNPRGVGFVLFSIKCNFWKCIVMAFLKILFTVLHTSYPDLVASLILNLISDSSQNSTTVIHCVVFTEDQKGDGSMSTTDFSCDIHHVCSNAVAQVKVTLKFHIFVVITFSVAPSRNNWATYLVTTVSVFTLVWLVGCPWPLMKFFQIQNFHQISKITKRKYVSGHSEQLWFLDHSILPLRFHWIWIWALQENLYHFISFYKDCVVAPFI